MDKKTTGVALVLVSGLLTLLMVLASALSGGARAASAGAEGARRAREASLAAESGLAYAAARLSNEKTLSYNQDQAHRGDVWIRFLDEATRLHNPAYGHGEFWTDLDTDGLHDHGEPQAPSWDLDGDGRFSAASGRLRGAEGPRRLSFSLQIDALDGLIPLNAGSLEARVELGVANTPDHRDLSIPVHAGLAHLLDNLGALVLPAGSPRRWTAQTGIPLGSGESFTFSHLGRHLIEGRPAGGYRDESDVGAALATLGYTPQEIDAVLPFMDVGPYPVLSEASRHPDPDFYMMGGGGSPDGLYGPCHTPVNLTVAPREVLVSLWRHASAMVWKRLFAARASDWNIGCERTGPSGGGISFGQLENFTAKTLPVVIYSDEAEAIADDFDAWRRSAPMDWRGFFRRLSQNVPLLFAKDHANLSGAPDLQASWTQAKAELAFRMAATDLPGNIRVGPHPQAARGWGIDRDGDPSNGIQQAAYCWLPAGGVNDATIGHVLDPGFGSTDYGPGNEYRPFKNVPFFAFPLGGAMAPPHRFLVRSQATARGPWPAETSLAGRLAAGERLEFSSQEEFENLQGGAGMSRADIRAVDLHPPEDRRDTRDDPAAIYGLAGPNRRYPHVASLPGANTRAYSPDKWSTPFWGFTRLSGALTLAGRERGLKGSRLYWAIKEDFDAQINNGGARTEDRHGDAWHESDGAFLPDEPLTNAIRASASPFCAGGDLPNGPSSPTFSCPPFNGPAGGEAPLFSIEARMGAGSSIELFNRDNPDPSLTQWLRLSAAPASLDDGTGVERPGLRFTLYARDSRLDGGGGSLFNTFGMRNPTCWVLDADAPTGNPASRHVVLVVSKNKNGTAKFVLYVDGTARAWDVTGIDLLIWNTNSSVGPFLTYPEQELSCNAVDELRIHGYDLNPAQVSALAGLDRFVREGVYRSPLYAFDTTVRMDRMQWTGIPLADPGYPALTIGTVRVKVVAYRTHDGTGPFVEAWSSDPGDTEDLVALGLSGLFGSFRYEVHFLVDPAFPAPLCDTPVFESIWFTFQRKGHSPRWLDFK